MPAVLNARAALSCPHLGRVRVAPSQGLVHIAGAPALVAGDTVGKAVAGCTVPPNSGPCTATTGVARGYSRLVHIVGRPVCLRTLEGPTNGAVTPTYAVDDAGQERVGASS